MKIKTAGKSAQILTGFSDNLKLFRNPHHWPYHQYHRVHWPWISLTVLGIVFFWQLLSHILLFFFSAINLLTKWLDTDTKMSPDDTSLSQKIGPPVIYWQLRQLDRLTDQVGTKRVDRNEFIKCRKGEEKKMKGKHSEPFLWTFYPPHSNKRRQVHLWKFVSSFCGN